MSLKIWILRAVHAAMSEAIGTKNPVGLSKRFRSNEKDAVLATWQEQSEKSDHILVCVNVYINKSSRNICGKEAKRDLLVGI